MRGPAAARAGGEAGAGETPAQDGEMRAAVEEEER